MNYKEKYNEILEWARKNKARLNGVPIEEVLPELKQKEQIPCTDFVIKPHKGDNTNPYDMPVPEAQEYAINRGFGIPFNNGEVYVDERHLTQTIGNILRWADEHPKEQKDYRKLYEDIAKSKWFKRAYEGKSLGDHYC